jgi:hypothetical protein
METTKIAEDIRAASSRQELAAWNKILESFKLLGMDVGFLRKRVDDLLGIIPRSSTDQPSVDCEGYEDVELEKNHAAEKMRAKYGDSEGCSESHGRRDGGDGSQTVKKTAQAMQQMANGPWRLSTICAHLQY